MRTRSSSSTTPPSPPAAAATPPRPVGPFYCPADQRVYLDLSFYEDMERQLGAPRRLRLGLRDRPRDGPPRPEHDRHQRPRSTRLEQRRPRRGATSCRSAPSSRPTATPASGPATVFAEGDLEAGDLDEAFTAAEAIGDDRLQEQAGQAVNPDSFTHGTSEQRREWFERGYASGDPADCDTFSPESI